VRARSSIRVVYDWTSPEQTKQLVEVMCHERDRPKQARAEVG
jgi:hypothetical protein